MCLSTTRTVVVLVVVYAVYTKTRSYFLRDAP